MPDAGLEYDVDIEDEERLPLYVELTEEPLPEPVCIEPVDLVELPAEDLMDEDLADDDAGLVTGVADDLIPPVRTLWLEERVAE